MKSSAPFRIKRGTNISHWLSQSNRRGKERAGWFTQEDVNRIGKLGFDHIRLPVDEVQLWSESGNPETEAWDLLDSALDWCEQAGLNVIVDLHILRSHYFNQVDTPGLFSDPREEKKLAGLWQQLSKHLQRRSPSRVAYEILNEAVAKSAEDWNRVAMSAFREIRRLEADRVIVLGSNNFNSPTTFDLLEVPEDPNCILTFHYYAPMLITHYKASWWRDGGFYQGAIQYPGKPIPDADWNNLDDSTKQALERFNVDYDRKAMVKDLAKPLEIQQKSDLSLYCGEFGCHKEAPMEVRKRWYRDIVSVFQEYQIGWSSWDYKGVFGIVTAKGEDTGVAGFLMGS